MRARVVTLLVAAVTATVLAGCTSPAQRHAAGQLRHELAGLPGVTSAAVTVWTNEAEYHNAYAAVALPARASVAEVRAVLAGLPTAVDKSKIKGLHSVEVVLSGETAIAVNSGNKKPLVRTAPTLVLDWPKPALPIAELATRLVLARDRLGALGQVVIGTGAATTVTAPRGSYRDIRAMASAVLADGQLASWSQGWTFDAGAWGASSGHLTTGTVLRPGTLTAFEALVAVSLPERARLLDVSVDQDYIAGRGQLYLRIQLNPLVEPNQLTPAVWAERLRPMLDALTAAAAAIGQDPVLTAANNYDGQVSSVQNDIFLNTGGPAAPDALHRGWNDQLH